MKNLTKFEHYKKCPISPEDVYCAWGTSNEHFSCPISPEEKSKMARFEHVSALLGLVFKNGLNLR